MCIYFVLTNPSGKWPWLIFLLSLTAPRNVSGTWKKFINAYALNFIFYTCSYVWEICVICLSHLFTWVQVKLLYCLFHSEFSISFHITEEVVMTENPFYVNLWFMFMERLFCLHYSLWIPDSFPILSQCYSE